MTLIQRECPCPPEIKICEIEDNEKANAMYNTEESEELDQADGGRDRLTPLPPIQSIKDFKAKYNRKFSAVSTQSECIDLSCPADSDYDDWFFHVKMLNKRVRDLLPINQWNQE